MPMLRLGVGEADEDAGATKSFASTVVAVVVVTVENESVEVGGSGDSRKGGGLESGSDLAPVEDCRARCRSGLYQRTR